MTAVHYRNFVRPAFSRGAHSTEDWVTWLQNEEVLHDFNPIPDGACTFCGGVCNPRYPTCWDCSHEFSGHLDRLVPAAYSLDVGLESILHRYKDFGANYHWMAGALGTIIWRLLEKHEECLGATLGRQPVRTWVPSNNPSRGFDHIGDALGAINGFRAQHSWRGDVIARNRDEARPARKEVAPEAYSVNRSIVRGRPVLLLDDVWTSGASMVSSAAALKAAGATTVIGVVLGRQLNRSFTRWEGERVFAGVELREWTLDECNCRPRLCV